MIDSIIVLSKCWVFFRVGVGGISEFIALKHKDQT